MAAFCFICNIAVVYFSDDGAVCKKIFLNLKNNTCQSPRFVVE